VLAGIGICWFSERLKKKSRGGGWS
jgi:hypothetical protein